MNSYCKFSLPVSCSTPGQIVKRVIAEHYSNSETEQVLIAVYGDAPQVERIVMHVAESSAHATSCRVTGPGHTVPGLQAGTSKRVGEQMVMFAKLPEHISACQIYLLAGPRQLD